MKRDKASLESSFVCMKCKCRKCAVQTVTLPVGPLSRMLPVPNGRYLALTCTLCGFTEFFNQAVFADSESAVAQEIELAKGTENA